MTVTELRENTFYALITLRLDGSEIEIDSRPSDAIALAVRAEAKIYVADDVIADSAIEFEGDEVDEEQLLIRRPPLADLDPAEFRKFLDTVTPEDFAAAAEPEGDEES